MKIYRITQKQFLPLSLQEAWTFFSNPRNLSEITPDKMDFRIQYVSGDGSMYPGQLIKYRIKLLTGVWVDWLTEITQVKNQQHFIDEQRFGPYAFWHHQHFFKEVHGGVEMTDVVNYAIPFGWIGRLTHWLFVRREVNAIFAHRYHILESRFNKLTTHGAVAV